MIKDPEKLVEHICSELKKLTDIAVVGLSGGVDSLVTTCLAVKALGKENVVNLHMPYGETDLNVENKFNNNSLKISKKLETVSYYKPITKIADEINNAVFGEFTHTSVQELSAINQGNSRARARMCLLYGVAHHLGTTTGKRVRVLGTGNLSEDFIGYDTKGGDSLWDIGLIGELFKSEVYQLAEYFVSLGMIEDSMIDRKPSAGLFEGQTDEGELGYSYNAMEPAVRKLRAGGEPETEIEKFVHHRYVTQKHKHEASPTFNIRNDFCD